MIDSNLLYYFIPKRNAEEPETLLQLLEKLCVFFERMKTGYLHEAWLLSGLVSTCLLDLLPASQVINKVITEFISPQQPHPEFLAGTLFHVSLTCLSTKECHSNLCCISCLRIICVFSVLMFY